MNGDPFSTNIDEFFKPDLSNQAQKDFFFRKLNKPPTQHHLELILVTMLNFQEHLKDNPANIYLFKVNNKNTRKRCEIY